ncbi:MAG TPA: molybdopterin-guanine dinucleotide biosynthesis protein B [Anaeromyxobacter sp.]
MTARRAPILAVSGASGAGKTRLLARLIPALARRGVTVAVLKHTRHDHPFDRPGKDTDVFRRAGALAAAIEGPSGMAWFGPPAGGLRALARTLPAVDLVLAEGFRREAVPRVEVHRRAVSRDFLCLRDRRVLAVVTDEVPPRALPVFDPDDAEGLADLLCTRLGIGGASGGRRRLRVRPGVSTLRANPGERTVALGRSQSMAKKTSRKVGRASRVAGRGGRSAAGRKGGNATLRNRGPEFYSEIGRKGGRSRSRNASRSAGRRGGAAKRGSSRSKSRSGVRRSSRRSSSSR